MKQWKTKCTIGILLCLIAYVSLNSWYRSVHPNAFIWCDEDKENAKWIATSKSWLDRKACRWIGVCGWLHVHLQFSNHLFGKKVFQDRNETDSWDWRRDWHPRLNYSISSHHQHSEIPDYVFEYAPLVHLFSGEQFWPCDPAEHLYHTTPELNYTRIHAEDEHENLSGLRQLNQWQYGQYVFLTSNDNVEDRPAWLEGAKNIPQRVSAEDALLTDNEGWVHHPARTYLRGLKDAAAALGKDLSLVEEDIDDLDHGNSEQSDEIVEILREEANVLLEQELKLNSARLASTTSEPKIRGGRSSAPAILITVPKPGGIVDAFWFFFYSFNLGNTVLGVRFGNHIGDWEHTAVRFINGTPQAVFFSEHNFGSAYTYEAVEKRGKRPIIYSATGTHAMYSTPGLQPYILPFGLLHDETDRGPLWDPALNHHAYTYDFRNDHLRPSNRTPDSPTGWFHYAGHWGDKFYPLGDSRQYRLVGQYHYVNGPLGPKFKNLGRKDICGGPDGTPCTIKHWLGGGGKIPRTSGNSEEADEFTTAYKQKIQFELR